MDTSAKRCGRRAADLDRGGRGRPSREPRRWLSARRNTRTRRCSPRPRPTSGEDRVVAGGQCCSAAVAAATSMWAMATAAHMQLEVGSRQCARPAAPDCLATRDALDASHQPRRAARDAWSRSSHTTRRVSADLAPPAATGIRQRQIAALSARHKRCRAQPACAAIAAPVPETRGESPPGSDDGSVRWQAASARAHDISTRRSRVRAPAQRAASAAPRARVVPLRSVTGWPAPGAVRRRLVPSIPDSRQ